MTFLHTTLNVVLPCNYMLSFTQSLQVFLPLSTHLTPATTTLQADIQSSTPQCSKCPNHIILPRLTTSATLSTPIDLLSSNEIPQIHLTIYLFLTFLAAIPWIVSATGTRSSALSNSAGRPTLNSLDNASSNTIHSSTPSYLSEHQLNHLLWQHFKRFLRINKGHPQDWSSFARYFSCNWRNIRIAYFKRPPCRKPNGMLSISNFFSPYFQWFFTYLS